MRVSGGCGAKNWPCDLVEICRTLGDGGVGAGHPCRPARPRLEGLAESELEISEAGVWPVAIADCGVDLRIGLEPQRCSRKPPADLFQRKPGAHDLWRLLARPCQDLRECEPRLLRGGFHGLKTHHRTHRDNCTSHY